MKILVDMNLSPDWVARFAARDIESVHWSTVGAPNAKDSEIMEFARETGTLFSRTIWISARCSPRRRLKVRVLFKCARRMFFLMLSQRSSSVS